MTTPDRSGNPDAMHRDAGLVYDGAVAPAPVGPTISQDFLGALRQPKAPLEGDPRFAPPVQRAAGTAPPQGDPELQEANRIFFQRFFGNNTNPGQSDWLGTQADIISFLQGSPHPSGGIAGRAYPIEKIPADPEVSSPWHNAIYEAFQPLHEWGARSFCIYWPNGGFQAGGGLLERNGLGRTMRKRTFTSAGVSTPLYQSPAMWMGYTQAIRSLIEGNMVPGSRPPILEPSNVMIYHEGFAGDPVWRGKTIAIWDSLGATAAERDTAYKALLDDLVEDFKAMRGRTPGSGRLYVTLDVGSEAATPSTLSLFRQLADSRSDIHELSDWYIATQLEQAGIEVFIESRPRLTMTAPNSGLGSIPSPQATQSEWRKFSAGYYWLRFSDPDLGDPGFKDFLSNEQAGKLFHVQDSNYPVQASKEPLGGTHVVASGAARRNLLDEILAGRVTYYTPHYRLDALYNLADNYRNYFNLKQGREQHKGVYVKTPALIAVGHEIFGGGSVHYAYNGSDITQYARVTYAVFDSYRPAFNKTSFLANPATYSEGYWTPEGNTYWDTQVRRPSFSAFVQFLADFVSLAAPPSAKLPVMREVDVYVSELPYETGLPQFTVLGAKRCCMIPQAKANQTHDSTLGTIDSAELLARIAGTGGLSLGVLPTVASSEMVLLDFATPYVSLLQGGPLYEPQVPPYATRASTIASMKSCLQAVRAAYPAKKWGFLDVPRMEPLLCDLGSPLNPNCEGDYVRIDRADSATRDAASRWIGYQAADVLADSDLAAAVLRQSVRMASFIVDDDQADRMMSEDVMGAIQAFKADNPSKESVAVVRLCMRSFELLNVSSNSGVGDYTFTHPAQIIGNCVVPALLKGADAVVVHHPWSEHSTLLFSALAPVGDPTRTSQLAIRAAYAARFMPGQTVSTSDDAYWALPATAQAIKDGLELLMLDLVQRIRALQGGSIESPSWAGNTYPDDYVSIQVLPADINSSSPGLGENQRVWSACWTNNNVLGTTSNGTAIKDVVPLVNVPGIRPPGPGAALSGTALDNLVNEIMSRPPNRRAILPTYWMYESPPNEELNLNNYYAATSDGTTYTGNIVGYGDPSPLRFMTPWAYTSTAHCGASITATLSALRQRGAEINLVCDDWEGWNGLGLGSPYNAYDGTFDVNGLPAGWTTNPNTSWKTVPDPRRTVAIVDDVRFGTTPVYQGKSFAELFFDYYQAIRAQFGATIPTPADKVAAARSLMGIYTNISSRQDFRSPWGIGTDESRAIWHAWTSVLEAMTCIQHNLGKWAGLPAYLDATGQMPGYYNYAKFPLSVEEGRYVFESNGHYSGPKVNAMPDIGAAPVLYGELSGGFYSGYGYVPSPTTDAQRYAWTAGATAMPSALYMAFVTDCVRLRGMLRSYPQAWQDLAPWICSPVAQNSFSRYGTDSGGAKYFNEICYHSFLAGAKFIQYFNQPVADDHFMQRAIDEWSRISNDKKVRPCSNQAGSVSQPVDRLQLNQAARMVVSGGMVVGSMVPRYIWRITVAPNVVSLSRTDAGQTDLPATIMTPSNVDNNDRGVWLIRTVPGMPAYSANIA